MFFIGIVTDLQSKDNIYNLVKLNKFLKENNVIFVNEANIDNIKNVHFDTIVINTGFGKIDELNVLLSNTKNLIVNIDVKINLKELNVSNLNLITYGFNSKSSVTISSVTDDEVLICIQRNLSCKSRVVEVQEIKVENNNYNVYDIIVVLVLFLMYSSSLNEIHIKGAK